MGSQHPQPDPDPDETRDESTESSPTEDTSESQPSGLPLSRRATLASLVGIGGLSLGLSSPARAQPFSAGRYLELTQKTLDFTGPAEWENAGSFTNTASGLRSVVGGGKNNEATDVQAVVAGGINNKAQGGSSIVGGGEENESEGGFATVAGGFENKAKGRAAVVGGGEDNKANEEDATVSGGQFNEALGFASTIGGGVGNKTTKDHATVPGGKENAATAMYSFAAGRWAKAKDKGSFVWSDSSGPPSFSSTGADQFLIEAAGGVGVGTDTPDTQLDVDGDTRLRGRLSIGDLGASAEQTKDITIGTGPTDVVYDTEIVDDRNEYDPSTGVFTCAAAGDYHVHAQVFWDGTPDEGESLFLKIRLNGSAVMIDSFIWPTDTSSGHRITQDVSKTMRNLTAGDEITITAQTATSSHAIIGLGDWANLQISQIG